MQIFNLTHGFEPFGPGAISLPVDSIFPGGEANIRLDGEIEKDVLITMRANTSHDLIRLVMATDALREMGAVNIHVFMPYLPYARQDRVCREGEAFSLRAFARLVNVQGYASVSTFEVHSAIAEKLIDGFENIDNREFVRQILADKGDFWMVYPDAGAAARYGGKVFGSLKIGSRHCLCGKVRNDAGAIAETDIPVDDFFGKDVYMIDDICDGGRTFIALAKRIRERNVGAVNLIVSHGIFSYGEQPLKDGGIDHVYTTDSIKEIDSPYITQVKLCDILT